MTDESSSAGAWRSLRATQSELGEEALVPAHGEVSRTPWVRIAAVVARPLVPLVRAIAPDVLIGTDELGRAMIRAARVGAPNRLLEMRDLHALASAH